MAQPMPLAGRLAAVVQTLAGHGCGDTAMLAQVWLLQDAHPNPKASTADLPYAIVGCSDELARFRTESATYTCTVDACAPEQLGAPGRVCLLGTAEVAHELPLKSPDKYERAALARSCGVRSAALVPMFADAACCRLVAVLEACLTAPHVPPGLINVMRHCVQSAGLHPDRDAPRTTDEQCLAVLSAPRMPQRWAGMAGELGAAAVPERHAPRQLSPLPESAEPSSATLAGWRAPPLASSSLPASLADWGARDVPASTPWAGLQLPGRMLPPAPHALPALRAAHGMLPPPVPHPPPHGLHGGHGGDAHMRECADAPVGAFSGGGGAAAAGPAAALMDELAGSEGWALDALRQASAVSQSSSQNSEQSTMRRRPGRPETKPLSLDMLMPQFGKPLKEAAKNLGVCPTTLKRACRRLGFPQWPRRQLMAAQHAVLRSAELAAASGAGAGGPELLGDMYAEEGRAALPPHGSSSGLGPAAHSAPPSWTQGGGQPHAAPASRDGMSTRAAAAAAAAAASAQRGGCVTRALRSRLAAAAAVAASDSSGGDEDRDVEEEEAGHGRANLNGQGGARGAPMPRPSHLNAPVRHAHPSLHDMQLDGHAVGAPPLLDGALDDPESAAGFFGWAEHDHGDGIGFDHAAPFDVDM